MKINIHEPLDDWFKWSKSFNTLRALIILLDLDFIVYIAEQNSCNYVLNNLFVIKASTKLEKALKNKKDIEYPAKHLFLSRYIVIKIKKHANDSGIDNN